MNVKVVILIFILIFIMFILFLFALLRPKNIPPIIAPSNSPYPSMTEATSSQPPPSGYSEQYLAQTKKVAEEQRELYDRNNKAGRLIESLPYKGEYFSLILDTDKARVVATISKNSKIQGDAELDSYLKSQDILDRSWILNLIVNYE